MATIRHESAVLHTPGGEKIPVKNVEISMPCPHEIKELKFTKDWTLSGQMVVRGVQCGKSNTWSIIWKWFMDEIVYQRPYRHMWE